MSKFTTENNQSSGKRILIVHAQPEPTSFTRYLVNAAHDILIKNGHQVIESNLYAMEWKAVFDEKDFPDRTDSRRLSFTNESSHAYTSGNQPIDVEEEQQKIKSADAIILIFPLWWYGMPAIMKGWIDRVWTNGFAYGYRKNGKTLRYGDGGFAGKRAMLAVAMGGIEDEFGPRGICGPIDQLLFPVTHGCLFYTGMEVLPSFPVFSTHHLSEERMASITKEWEFRLEHFFDDKPISFRAQEGGDFTSRYVLNDDIAAGQTGFDVLIKS